MMTTVTITIAGQMVATLDVHDGYVAIPTRQRGRLADIPTRQLERLVDALAVAVTDPDVATRISQTWAMWADDLADEASLAERAEATHTEEVDQ